MTMAMDTRPIRGHLHPAFGIGAIPLKGFILRYPNARFRGNKLFSDEPPALEPIASPLRVFFQGRRSQGSALHYRQILAASRDRHITGLDRAGPHSPRDWIARPPVR